MSLFDLFRKKKPTPKPVTICFGLPVDDGARPQFWQSIMAAGDAPAEFYGEGISFIQYRNDGDSLITRARNDIAHAFLTKTKADYLLFIDSDLEFTPDHLKSLLDHRREDAVICGQYCIKSPDLRFVCNPLPGEKKNAAGLLKVRESGTGCMLIPRAVLEKFKEAFPALEFTCEASKEKKFSFFDVGVVKDTPTRSRYYSEDYLFCRRVRQIGFPILVDTNCIWLHHGWAAYPLSDDALISAIASRAPTEEYLQSYLRDIDKAARARWTTLSLPDSHKELEQSKVS